MPYVKNIHKASPRKGKGSVYILQQKLGEPPYKIGYTAGNVMRRIRELNTGNPQRLTLRAVISDLERPAMIEAAIHNELGRYRLEGEWFDVPDERITNLMQEYGGINVNKREYFTRGS